MHELVDEQRRRVAGALAHELQIGRLDGLALLGQDLGADNSRR